MTPATECPRYAGCSVNNCPLTTRYPHWPVDPNDVSRACPMEKGVRVRIAARHPGALQYGGLTKAEHTARARYDALPADVKARMAEQGKARLLARREKATSEPALPRL
jgi:hypothetical protein